MNLNKLFALSIGLLFSIALLGTSDNPNGEFPWSIESVVLTQSQDGSPMEYHYVSKQDYLLYSNSGDMTPRETGPCASQQGPCTRRGIKYIVLMPLDEGI